MPSHVHDGDHCDLCENLAEERAYGPWETDERRTEMGSEVYLGE